VFDVAVIGAGVVGCAVARRLTLDGARVVLVEAGSDILSGASKANSALLHTGFDAPVGSLECRLMQAGYREYCAIREELGLPLLETGAMVVAWSDEERQKLDGIETQARENGVVDVRRLSRSEALAREPNLAPSLVEALLVPGEHVIDPWSAPLAYVTEAVVNGARLRLGTQVSGGTFDGRRWRLETGGEPLEAGLVVNCAGLHGDRLEQALLGTADFTIKPRKGQFVVYDKAAAALVGTIVLPVPTERTKGIVLARTVFGNLLVGPTAEEQEERDRAALDEAVLSELLAKAEAMLPALEDMPVTAVYAGLRPATERKEYRVMADRERRMVRLGGIRSTGLTAALGLAGHVAELIAGWPDLDRAPIAAPRRPRLPNLAEHEPRDWQAPGHGGIVCHCELVTAREIEAALDGPVPARDFGGLRRRTRAAMGRCQGFHCLARITSLTEGRLAIPLSTGPVHG
jgi:glycerol-3-phosphate dehydrogenase